MKSGIVALVGRPNAGKSTLLNAILKQKVAITSPKPQTTRFPIQAVFDDDRGQIVFVDTPGIFGKTPDTLSQKINKKTEQVLSEKIDLILYIIDHTREREHEENRVFGMVRKSSIPKILVINKIDIKVPTHIVQYRFMRDEFDTVVEVSAMTGAHINTLLSLIFDVLPEGAPLVDVKDMVQPAINLTSKQFVAEIIREKAFLNLRKEVPYSVTTVVDEVIERENGNLFIKARLLTNQDKYKGMLVGKGGSMIREISMAARKELEVASSKKVFLELTVEVDPHWMEVMA